MTNMTMNKIVKQCCDVCKHYDECIAYMEKCEAEGFKTVFNKVKCGERYNGCCVSLQCKKFTWSRPRKPCPPMCRPSMRFELVDDETLVLLSL